MAQRTPLEDPFLVEGNAFVRIHFQIMDTTISGLDINAEGVAVHPASSADVAIMRGVTTADFVVWSGLGAAKTACAAPGLGGQDQGRDAALAFATAAANAETTPFVHTLSALPREAHEQLAAVGGEGGEAGALDWVGDDGVAPSGAWRAGPSEDAQAGDMVHTSAVAASGAE